MVLTGTLRRALRKPEYAQVVPLIVQVDQQTPAVAAGAELAAQWGVPLKNVIPQLNMFSVYAPRAVLGDIGALKFVRRVSLNRPVFALQTPPAVPAPPAPPAALLDPLGLMPWTRDARAAAARDEAAERSIVRATTSGWVPTYEALKAVHALELHETGITGAGVKVAVLDTGIDNQQVQVAGTVPGHAYVLGEGPEDTNGHGTHVTTILKGGDYVHPVNGLHVLGGAPDASVSMYKVLGRIVGVGETDDIIKAMVDALEAGNKIISMSLGGELGSEEEEREDLMMPVIEWAAEAYPDAIFVVAAGNSGPDARTIGTPAAAEHAVTVGSMSAIDAGAAAYFSSRGPTWGKRVKPDICGLGGGRAKEDAKPSENIFSGTAFSTVVDASDKSVDSFGSIAGTSMACPQVASVISLWKQLVPELTTGGVKALFERYGKKKDNVSGHGLINATWIRRAIEF